MSHSFPAPFTLRVTLLFTSPPGQVSALPRKRTHLSFLCRQFPIRLLSPFPSMFPLPSQRSCTLHFGAASNSQQGQSSSGQLQTVRRRRCLSAGGGRGLGERERHMHVEYSESQSKPCCTKLLTKPETAGQGDSRLVVAEGLWEFLMADTHIC